MSRRVVVTGLGALTPLGLDLESTWSALVAGKSGARTIASFDPSSLPVRMACELKGFDVDNWIDKRESRKMDPSVHYGVAAALMAWKDSGLADSGFDAGRVGAIIGSGVGGIQTLEAQHTVLMEKGPRRISPFFIPMLIPDMSSGMVSIMLGLKGPNFATVSACASGAHAIGTAYRAIQHGDADAIVTGGTEAAISLMSVAVSQRCERSRPGMTNPSGHLVRSTPNATASSWARAPASLCSRNSSTRRSAERRSTPSSWATERQGMRIT